MDSIANSVTSSNFSISNILSESWKLTHGSKWPIWLASIAAILIFAFIMAIGMAIFTSTGIIEHPVAMNHYQANNVLAQNFWPTLLCSIVGFAVASPLFAGIFLIGVKRARGQIVPFSEGFAYFHRYLPLIFAAVCIAIIVDLGYGFVCFGHSVFGWTALTHSALMHLARLIALILAIFVFLALPLVADKNMNAFSAIALSFRKASTHWFKILLTWILLGVIFLLFVLCVVILSMIVFGLLHVLPVSDSAAKNLSIFVGAVSFLVLYIWFYPYTVLVGGVIYHKLIDE